MPSIKIYHRLYIHTLITHQMYKPRQCREIYQKIIQLKYYFNMYSVVKRIGIKNDILLIINIILGEKTVTLTRSSDTFLLQTPHLYNTNSHYRLYFSFCYLSLGFTP